MNYPLNFVDVRDYLAQYGLTLSCDLREDKGYLVEYPQGDTRQANRPRHYRSLYNALYYNGPGVTDEEVKSKFEAWKMQRWNKGA